MLDQIEQCIEGFSRQRQCILATATQQSPPPAIENEVAELVNGAIRAIHTLFQKTSGFLSSLARSLDYRERTVTLESEGMVR
jgi:hypothetical protein